MQTAPINDESASEPRGKPTQAEPEEEENHLGERGALHS